MKALFLSFSNGGGGAGRATNRLFSAMTENTDLNMRMYVDFKHGADPRIITSTKFAASKRRTARINLEELPAYVTKHPVPKLFSPGIASSISAKSLDRLGADVINLHWSNYGLLSIPQIAQIETPLIWTLHDMWSVTGGMNYEPDLLSQQVSNYKGIEAWIAHRKKRHWTKPLNVVTPSNWLANIIRSSELGQDWKVTVIPNPIDLNIFAPIEAHRSNTPNSPLKVIVSLGGDLIDSRKGFDLLIEALPNIESEFELMVIGHEAPPSDWPESMPRTRWLGFLNDSELVNAYAEADVAVVPSRQDNLPQTATEPTACGVPLVAFNIGGLPDIVENGVTGLLADPEDPIHLASQVDVILKDEDMRRTMSGKARKRAERLWSPSVVANQYLTVFNDACKVADQ